MTPNERTFVFGEEITGLRQKFSKFKISGFTDIKSTDARFVRYSEICNENQWWVICRMDFAHKILYLDLVVPKLVCSFEYEAHGRMVLVPVDVVSAAAATLSKYIFPLLPPVLGSI